MVERAETIACFWRAVGLCALLVGRFGRGVSWLHVELVRMVRQGVGTDRNGGLTVGDAPCRWKRGAGGVGEGGRRQKWRTEQRGRESERGGTSDDQQSPVPGAKGRTSGRCTVT